MHPVTRPSLTSFSAASARRHPLLAQLDAPHNTLSGPRPRCCCGAPGSPSATRAMRSWRASRSRIFTICAPAPATANNASSGAEPDQRQSRSASVKRLHPKDYRLHPYRHRASARSALPEACLSPERRPHRHPVRGGGGGGTNPRSLPATGDRAHAPQLPIHCLGFHSDCGSEYVNQHIAKMLNKLNVEFTSPGPGTATTTPWLNRRMARGSQDHALCAYPAEARRRHQPVLWRCVRRSGGFWGTRACREAVSGSASTGPYRRRRDAEKTGLSPFSASPRLIVSGLAGGALDPPRLRLSPLRCPLRGRERPPCS